MLKRVKDAIVNWIDHTFGEKLVSDWRDYFRMWSVRLNAVGLAILSWVYIDPISTLYVWSMMPPEVRAILPYNIVTHIGFALFALGMLARVVKQPAKKKDEA